MAKKKLTYLQKREQMQTNKKAIIWVSSGLAAIVILMTVLLILNR